MDPTEHEIKALLRKGVETPGVIALMVADRICNAVMLEVRDGMVYLLDGLFLRNGRLLVSVDPMPWNPVEDDIEETYGFISNKPQWYQFLAPGEPGYDWWADRIKAAASKARLKGVQRMAVPVSILS